MSLLYPVMLASAAAVIVPVLIHLFGRPRPRLTRFPSLMLLVGAHRQRHTRTRVRRIIALILRCLALALLALMLARPLTAWSPLAVLGESLGAIAILVDRSPSMKASLEDGSTPWERADQAADSVADALGPNARILPARAGTSLRPLLGRESVDMSEAQAALAAIGRTDERARIATCLEQLAAMDEEFARVFVITDLQATSLERISAPATALRVSLIDVGDDIAGNAALVDVRSDRPVHLRRRAIDLQVTARSWGDRDGRIPVTAELLEGDVSAGVDLEPGTDSIAALQFTPQTPGPLVTTLRLPPDDMPADDRRIVAAMVRDRLRVGMVGSRATTRFIHAALNPYPEGDARSIVAVSAIESSRDVTVGEFDAIVVTSPGAVGADLADTLAAAAREGTGVLVYSEEAPDASLLESLGLEGVRFEGLRTPQDGARLVEMETARPPLAEFADPGAGDLSAPTFREVRDIVVNGDGAPAVLARLDDGTPLLVEGAVGAGRTLLLAASPDASMSDLVRMPEFVPLMHRLVTYLAAGVEPAILDASPGETVVVELPRGHTDARPVGPGGDEIAHEIAEGCLSFVTGRVGAFRIVDAGEDIAVLAVNLDPAEADPARLNHVEARNRLSPLRAEVVAWDHLDDFLETIGPEEADISVLFAFLALLVLAIEAVQSLQPDSSSSRNRDE